MVKSILYALWIPHPRAGDPLAILMVMPYIKIPPGRLSIRIQAERFQEVKAIFHIDGAQRE